MKLRIIEVFDAIISPWFHLQKWNKETENWDYSNSDDRLEFLCSQAQRMLDHDVTREVVIQEFTNEPESFVDFTPPLEDHAPNG